MPSTRLLRELLHTGAHRDSAALLARALAHFPCQDPLHPLTMTHSAEDTYLHLPTDASLLLGTSSYAHSPRHALLDPSLC